jgi:transcriptional regulator GlxA family with amidase domain
VAERNDTPISVADLGHAAGLSRSRITTLFAEQMSVSPQWFIESVRLDRAAQFLRMSRRPVARIAERSGFTNAFYFPMRFRRRYGVSPSGYRAMIEGLELDPFT